MTDDISTRMAGCSCGADHDTSIVCDGTSDAGLQRRVETAVLRAAFPDAMTRRSMLAAVGSATLSAALSQIFPIATATDALLIRILHLLGFQKQSIDCRKIFLFCRQTNLCA